MAILSVSPEGATLFGMTAGTAAALIAYVGKIFSPLESLGMEIENIQSAMAGVHRIREFMEEEEMALPKRRKRRMTCPSVSAISPFPMKKIIPFSKISASPWKPAVI